MNAGYTHTSHRHRSGGVKRLALAALIVPTVAACGGVQQAAPPPSLVRLIDADPSELFEPSRMFDSSEVTEWRFTDESLGQEEWAPVELPGAAWQQTPEGLLLRSDEGPAFLVLNGAFSSRDFDAIEVEAHPALSGETMGGASLAWAGRGETLSPERVVTAPVAEAQEARPDVFRFPLREHPLWRQGASRLRLALRPPPGGIVVERIALVRDSLARERLAAVKDKAVEATLADELRPAVIGVPDAVIHWPIDVPRAATLRFFYGVPAAFIGRVGFRVSFVADDGTRTPLFEKLLEPGDDIGRWHRGSIDLAEYGGSSGELELETTAASSAGPLPGLGLWGNPRITSFHPDDPNILLISVDTLRPDRMSLYGYDRRTTPTLDDWARSSATVFEAAIAQSTWTLPSHVSMLTGTDAFHHGVNYSDDVAPDSLVFLQELLQRAGYFTMAVTGGGLVHPRYGFQQGFDQYWSYPGSRATGDELPEGLGHAIAWLDDAADTPFFLFFHTYEVHTPWRSRQPWFDEFSDLPPVEDLRLLPAEQDEKNGFLSVIDDSSLDLVRPPQIAGLQKRALLELAGDAYDSGIAYTDEQIGRLLKALSDRGLLSNTIVVLTSDHGELLGEHGVLGHRYLYEENIRVPLAIALPEGGGAGRRVASQVRSIDIVPTVLDAAGLELPADLDGRSLLPFLSDVDEPRAASPREAWTYAPEVNFGLSLRVDNRIKYTFNDTAWAPLNGSEAVFDLVASPGESRNVLPDFAGVDALYASMFDRITLVPGLRIRLRSGPDQRFEGFVEGAGIHTNRVKSIDLPCRCVRWEPQKAVFEVPMDTEYTLVVPAHGDSPFVLQLFGTARAPGTGDSGDLRVEVDAAGLDGHRFFALGGDGWQELQDPPEAATIVDIWWQGRVGPVENAGDDEQLLERLRALGYLR